LGSREDVEQVFLLEQAASRLRAGEQVSQVRTFIDVELETSDLKNQATEMLRISAKTGSAPASALTQLAQFQRERIELQRKLQSEFATPRATVRLVTALPFVVLVFTQLLGLPVIEVIVHNRLAQVSVLSGAGLLILGQRWSRRILRAAEPKPESASYHLEMLANALRCGLGFRSAAEAVGLPRELDAQLTTEKKLARERGSPIADLVQLRAQSIRDRHAHEGLLIVRDAAVRLMVPLGATVLPALLFLLVVPLAIGLTQPTFS
jgi:tight adherence protein B